MRYAVRCNCCHPSTVLGWLHLPAGMRDLEVPEACVWLRENVVPHESPVRHGVQVREYVGPLDGVHEWAVCSNARPLSFWLTLSGFEANAALEGQHAAA